MPARVFSKTVIHSAMGRAGAAVAVLVMLAAATGAQTITGTINGTVLDTTQAALPGVSIVVKNLDTGVSQEYVTNERGFYNAPFLPLGRYEVTATLAGFGPVTRRDVEVTLNFTNVINFRLDPQITDEVVVTAERPPINKVSGEVKQSMSAEQILEKPTFQNLNPTNTFLSLAETFAGFNENGMSGQNNPTASSGSSVNFNGTGTRGTTFQIDGVNNDDSSENQNRQGVNVASIREFQIITNAYSAEFGRGSGAVVLVQTKSGTNQVHGEASFTRQDSDWDSRQFFATTKPVNHRNNYSGVVGFPLIENKLFAFVTAEYGERSGDTNYTRDIFTAAEKSQPRLTRGNDTPANRAFIESVLARFGDLTPNDPRSPRTYSGLVGFSQPVQDFSGKIDWEVRRDDRMNVRYQYSRQKFDNEDIIIGEATQQNNRQANLGATWTRTWTNRIVGEFRYGLGIRDTNVNIKEGNDTPIIRFAGTPVSGSIIGNAGTFPITRDQVDNQFVYNVSALFGSDHNLKFGTDIRLQQLDDLAQSFQRGFWSFNANCGGVLYSSSYAAFLDGCIASFQTAYGPFYLENSINEYNFYAEDNWRVSPTLTVNLGLRYELAGAAREDEDRLDYRYGDDTDNIEPRIGVAWAPAWTDGWLGRLAGQPGDFSIRSGYGIYHGRIFQSVFSQTGNSVRTNPPNATALSIGNVLPNVLNVSDPTLGYVFVPGPQTARHAETWPDDALEMPSSHQWNLTIERAMPWQSTFRASYTGTNGVGLLRYRNENLAVTPAEGGIVVVNHPNNAPTGTNPDLRGVKIDKVASDWLCAGTGFITGIAVNATCPNPVPIANNEISLRVPRNNERRPDPQFTTNAIIANDSESWYNALQLEWIKRVSNGIRFEANYTWSKATDYGSEFVATGGDSNSLGPDPQFYKGLSRFHTPHRFTFNWSWALPFFANQQDIVGAFLGGWQLTGVWRLAHGTPFTVIDSAGGDLNWDAFSENRPVILDASILGRTVNDVNNSATDQLPRSAFRRATPDDYGKDLIGRNTFYGDYINNVDLALLKSFRMPVGRMMFRLEAFNAFNRVRFNLPSNDFNATTFGRITGQLNTSRQIQFGLRYIF